MEEPFPNFWDIRGLLDRSTSVPAYNVVYRLIQAGNTSSESLNVSFDTVNATSDPEVEPERDEGLARIEIAVQATIFALAVVGNACVLVALGRRRKIASRMHMFILHLSIADLLVAFCNILPQLAWDITDTFQGGDVLCRVVTFLQVFVMYLSTYVLVMTAVDRYRAICYPLSNYNWTSSTVNCMVAGVYLLSAILSIPQPVLFKYKVVNEAGDFDCWVDFDPPWLMKVYILTFTFLVYLVPFLILVFAYGSICYTIWAKQPMAGCHVETEPSASCSDHHHGANAPSRFAMSNGNAELSPVSSNGGSQSFVHSTPQQSRRWTVLQHSWGRGGRSELVRPRVHSVRGFSRAKLKTVKLTFVVIVAYLLCWSPFFISQLWWLVDPDQEANRAVVIMVLLGSLNSCCNPWIYLAFSGNLLRHVFPCLAPCCHTPAPRAPPFLFNTPSNSPQRGFQMLVFRGRGGGGSGGGGGGNGGGHLHDGTTPNDTTNLTLGGRRDLYGSVGSVGTSPALRKKKQGFPLRQGSLSSLLTTRLSRNNTLEHPYHPEQQQQQQQKDPAVTQSVPQTHPWDALLCSSTVEGLASFENSASASIPTATNSAASSSAGITVGGQHSRTCKVPLELIIPPHDEDGPASPSTGKESSSGSNPRSPHLFKRARLHERPAEEVAEAQLKWEHNMGLRGPSIS